MDKDQIKEQAKRHGPTVGIVAAGVAIVTATMPSSAPQPVAIAKPAIAAPTAKTPSLPSFDGWPIADLTVRSKVPTFGGDCGAALKDRPVVAAKARLIVGDPRWRELLARSALPDDQFVCALRAVAAEKTETGARATAFLGGK